MKRRGKVVEKCDAVDEPEVDDEVTFAGDLTITGIDLSERNEVLVSGRLQGQLEGRRSENVDVTFEGVSLGTLGSIFTVHPADDPTDCPIVEIDVGDLYLEVLGIRTRIETIEIDTAAILGEDTLLSDLVCPALQRFSSQ